MAKRTANFNKEIEMATLHKDPYPGVWTQLPGEEIGDYVNRIEKQLYDIPRDKKYTYPVADGEATYFIVSESPLVLQLVPAYDAYEIPTPHMKGLKLADIQKARRFASIFE
jgi:hypothetical protein